MKYLTTPVLRHLVLTLLATTLARRALATHFAEIFLGTNPLRAHLIVFWFQICEAESKIEFSSLQNKEQVFFPHLTPTDESI